VTFERDCEDKKMNEVYLFQPDEAAIAKKDDIIAKQAGKLARYSDLKSLNCASH